MVSLKEIAYHGSFLIVKGDEDPELSRKLDNNLLGYLIHRENLNMQAKESRKLLDQPQEVINRWARIKAINTFRPFIEEVFRIKLRISLKISERDRQNAMKNAFETTIREYRKLKDSDYEATKTLFNISLFFLLAEKDLQAIKVDAFSHRDPWKRNLSLRIMLLIIHERDLSKVASGNKMKVVYEQANISDDLKESMVAALRGVSKAQKKTQKLLSEMRNNTIAHRDSDAMLQYELIEKTDMNAVKEIITEYFEASHIFFRILPTLMIEASSIQSLFAQLTNAKPNK